MTKAGSMLQETPTGAASAKICESIYLGVAAVLALPATSFPSVRTDRVLEAWRDRLLTLNEHDELADFIEIICRARYEALGLQLDLLRDYEEDGDIEDF